MVVSMAGKSKGYIFTSKKISKYGIMSTVLGITSLAAFAAANVICFGNRGMAGERLGGVGLVALLFAVACLAFSVKGISEKEDFQLFPRVGLALGIMALCAWGAIIYFGVTGL